MDQTQDLLFGQAPRRVGTPEQHWVYSPGQVEFFIDSINGRRNAYATLGWWDFADGSQICDKVLYDLDSPAKSDREGERWDIFDGDIPDDEAIRIMREDADVADRILGEPVEDARKLARKSLSDNVPVVGVFSGFGIHVHQLFKPTAHPRTAMSTTAYRYIEETGAGSVDVEILGQPERICRIPNCERIAGPIGEDGRPTGLFTIPLSGRELASVTVQWLLDESHTPRLPTDLSVGERPQMHVWDDYKTGYEETADIPPRPLHPEETEFGEDSDFRALLEDLLQMPCMVERLLDDPNPDHKIRVNAAIMLLNTGLDPRMVTRIFEQVGWVDYDYEETLKQVKSIYRNGYSDMSCQSLRAQGFCVRSEEPKHCPTFGWSGGKPEWKT